MAARLGTQTFRRRRALRIGEDPTLRDALVLAAAMEAGDDGTVQGGLNPKAALAAVSAKVYRSLRSPVGALNHGRFLQFMDRYRNYEDPTGQGYPPFLYGSHYSTSGIVVFFLLRQEPFASLAIELQSGRFDTPDRVFQGTAHALETSLTSMVDVKELVPDVATGPLALSNHNALPLGVLADGTTAVGDVLLPQWARDSPHRFAWASARALESTAVSKGIAGWIDLVFGAK